MILPSKCLPGPPGVKGQKGEKGLKGIDGSVGVSGPPGHVFLVPLPVSKDTKGPDNTEALRAILEQHKVVNFCYIKLNK